MKWDYDKLFAEGNVVGIRNKKLDYIFIHKVHPKEIKNILKDEEVSLIEWDDYKNENLSCTDKFEISWIIQLDDNGNFLRKLFDRNKDIIPELKNGMMIWVKTEYDDEPRIGIVSENKVIYQNGGFDDIDGDDSVKNEIISVYNHGHGFGYCLAEPIWGKDMKEQILEINEKLA